MSEPPIRVAIDTVAGAHIGIGHLVRSVTLAERLRQANGDVRFVSDARRITPFITSRLAAAHFRPYNARSAAPEVVVVDRPDTSPAMLRALRRRWPGAALVALDYYDAPVEGLTAVVNLNLARQRHRRDCAPIHWRGLRYAILRESFARLRRRRREARTKVRQVLVGFGGTDPQNWSTCAAAVLQKHLARDVSIHLMAGRGDSRSVQGVRVNAAPVFRHAQIADPAPLMLDSDIVIIGGGTMLMEAACLGVPAVVVPRTREELLFAREFARSGAVTLIAAHRGFPETALARQVERLVCDVELRRRMRRAGRAMIDGRGTERVAQLVLSIARTAP